MAYQNVNTPKFYIDYLSYSKAIGAGGTVTASGDNFPDNLNSFTALGFVGFSLTLPAYFSIS